MNFKTAKTLIEQALTWPDMLSSADLHKAVFFCLRGLEQGTLRVATPYGLDADSTDPMPMTGDLTQWQVHPWIKHAILLGFKLRTTAVHPQHPDTTENVQNTIDRCYQNSPWSYADKFDLQPPALLAKRQIRSVPGALVREGCYVSSDVILMPSFINVGAYVGRGSMVDTWATVGSCAQIGRNVHLAGGVGIGGVLEPAQARPVLIGDDAFLGSRVIVVEGVVIQEKAILAAQVCLTGSTPIYDMTQQHRPEYRGVVPAGAVVVSGTRTKTFPGGEVPIQCAYIIAYRSTHQDAKVSLNQTLRETGVVV